MSPDPVQNQAEDDNAKADRKTDVSVLNWLAKDGPKWARVPAILAILLVALASPAVLVINSVKGLTPKIADSNAAKELQTAAVTDVIVRNDLLKKAISDLKKGSPLTAEEQSNLDDITHQLGHVTNPLDDVKWVVFAKKDKQNYFGYKLFPSDHCLLIARIENGAGRVQWLRDPNSAPPPPPQDVPKPTAAAFSTSPDTLNFQPLKVVLASLVKGVTPTSDFNFPAAKPLAEEIQGLGGAIPAEDEQANCLNPHPWPFQETAGPYFNQCQQPIYRRWADGCFHVQVFDHCANVWGPVNWQFCAANHHP
jgi:hypothetical protein